MAELPRRLVTVANTTLNIVTFTDRRAQSNVADFLFQSELERLLFGGHEPVGLECEAICPHRRQYDLWIGA